MYTKEKEICPAYISKINSNCEKQIILLMVPNKEKEGWHYLAIKKLSALLYGITSKHKGDFYCLNCLHYFKTENTLKSHEKLCKNKDFCGIVMPSEKDKMLKRNQYMKCDKMQYIIYADMECLIKKLMDEQVIQTFLQQKKLESIFIVDIQCQQCGHLIT